MTLCCQLMPSNQGSDGKVIFKIMTLNDMWMQSVTEICALLFREVVTAFVVSALAGSDLFGSLSTDLLLLAFGGILHLLQNCRSNGHNYRIMKVFAETFVAWVAMRWYRSHQNRMDLARQHRSLLFPFLHLKSNISRESCTRVRWWFVTLT